MINNNRRFKDVNSELDNIVDMMGITDNETDMPPISDEERATIKLQLLQAQILSRDINEIVRHNPRLSKEQVMEDLCNNWIENIKCLTKEILKEKEFQLDIISILKDFNSKY